MPQFVDQHRVAEVQIGRGGVETRLNSQWYALFELFDEFGFDQQLVAAATYGFELRCDIRHEMCLSTGKYRKNTGNTGLT